MLTFISKNIVKRMITPVHFDSTTIMTNIKELSFPPKDVDTNLHFVNCLINHTITFIKFIVRILSC